MSGWQVQARLPDGAITMFGVYADTGHAATVKALQQLAAFPQPWHAAEITVTAARSPDRSPS